MQRSANQATSFTPAVIVRLVGLEALLQHLQAAAGRLSEQGGMGLVG